MNSLQRMNRMENRQDTLEATVKMYIQKMDERDRQTREELRAMNERREAMEAKREADMREMREKREADMKAMRERQEAMEAKREADMQAMRERQEAMEAKREADMQTMREKREQDRKELYELVDRLDKKIDSKFDGLMKHLQTLTVSAVVGVGAIIVAIVIYTK